MIDLEYLLERDADAFEDELRTRDRAFFLASADYGDGTPPPPRDALKAWLDYRREDGPPLPGAAVARGWHMAGVVMAVLGTVVGGSVAAGLLHYTGRRPINIAVVLDVLVGLQVLSLLLMAVGFAVRKARHSSVLTKLPSRFLRWLTARAAALFGGALDGDREASLRTYAGLVARYQQLYGKTFFWQLFGRFQLFGVTFNLGALAVVLFKVMTADLAFGWQSTLRAGADQVYALARAMATPWAWLAGEGTGYPTLSVVEGSRIVLKDGIYHLASEDLAAWWPFLCLALVFYGLLPRLALHGAAHGMQHRSFNALTFRHADAERLYRRMTVPILRADHSADAADAPSQTGTSSSLALDRTPGAPGSGPVLVPHDLLDVVGLDGLTEWLAPNVRLLGQPIVFGRDVAEDREAMASLHRTAAEAVADAVFIVCEAWQPPIQEFDDFLVDVRATVGAHTPVWVVLAGRVRGEGEIAAAKADHVKIWARAMDGRGDPYLGLLDGGIDHGS